LASTAQFASAAELDLRYKSKVDRGWTGCFAGVQVGIGATQDTFSSEFSDFSDNGQWGFGVLGGAQVGCNYQLGRFVVGLESEFWGSSLGTESKVVIGGFDGFALTATTSNPWTFASSIRAGLTFDEFWVYLKGGAAWAAFHYNVTSTDFALRGSAVSSGVLLGLGIEYALGLWTAKVETDVLFFSAIEVPFSDTEGGFRSSVSATQFLFKLGVNRRFDFDEPPPPPPPPRAPWPPPA
jgi:outer membrane immunogenic protein